MFRQLTRLCRELAERPLALVYPGMCAACGGALPPGRDRFCAPCRATLTADSQPTCPRCASTVGPFAALADGCSPAAMPPSISSVLSAWDRMKACCAS